jgi:hypothetical protein
MLKRHIEREKIVVFLIMVVVVVFLISKRVVKF